jgi:hypothetical protein
MLALLLLLLIVLIWYIYIVKIKHAEHLAPMLKRALQGDELSYQSNLGPGFIL